MRINVGVMQLDFTRLISKNLSLDESCVSHTIKLLSEGATIPFISRYRKEFTGGLDEVQVASVKELLEKLTELSKRKAINIAKQYYNEFNKSKIKKK
jgi:transcriptional accessory protein Tex/SPT6